MKTITSIGSRPAPGGGTAQVRIAHRQSGVALLMTLLILSLITIIVVAFLGTMTWETLAARRSYETQKARSLAILGMNTAVAQLRNALGVWDNPFVNFTNAPATNYYWSVSPGILTRWSYNSTAPLTNYPLFSIDPNGSTALVNLNAAEDDGTYPIASAPNTNISVYWANVLKYPTVSANSTNPIIGRYAFWVDDENAKININTADGTLKYTINSLGLGTPSEVSLQVLQSGGTNISTQMATNIVYLARTTGFNSPREILRASGAAYDLYTNNVFDITTYGRAPELNIFGEPKINCIPASTPGSPLVSPNKQGYLDTNAITGQALREIYPTPNQLPSFSVTDLGVQSTPMTDSWRPMIAPQTDPLAVTDNGAFGGDNYGYEVGLISLYLSGTNSMGKPIQWPVFPYPSGGSAISGSNGFLDKYSLRQLDCLALQVVDLTGKAITPEANNESTAQTAPFTTPFAVPGILSHQYVPGMARSAKINEILIETTAYGATSITSNGTTTYTPPKLSMSVYLETWLPAGFGGVDLLNVSGSGLPPVGNYISSYELGGRFAALNALDLLSPLAGDFFPVPPVTAANYGYYPRTPPQPYAANQTNSYWCDTVLQNNVGIDFVGNPRAYDITNPAPDPDQVRATVYHQGFAANGANDTNSSGQFLGSGPVSSLLSPVLAMGYLSGSTSYTGSGTNVWYPGQYRMVVNEAGEENLEYPMMTNATSVIISGGLIINGHTIIGCEADPDPTPFDAGIRGPRPNGWLWCSYDNESMTSNGTNNLAWATPPGAPNQTTYLSNPTETLESRVLNGVVPVNFTVAVPSLSTSAGEAGNTAWYHAEVADPLVNKFPGDWITNASSANTMGGSTPPTVGPTGGGIGGYAVYYNGQNASAVAATVNSPYYDPDSFWMPPLDPKIPRSARMPNIGYLNYLRTGIIPDDETVPIQSQHGMPYRCLNFNAISDSSQTLAVAGTTKKTYPDWALLDLFTIPSTLLPYHGPYGYYDFNNNNTWTTGSMMMGNPTNMYNYGTWGGSTPGRINPNGSVIYTTNVTMPTPGITRTLPLQALLHNLMVNQTNACGWSAATATTNAPTLAGGSQVNDAGIASSIATYIGTYGPLREPAEICNIPDVSANVATGFDGTHNNPTRNDLVRQIIGNLTTQSNTFSIWVAGESISKSKTTTNYGIYESGDQVTASVRYHFIVERYLDTGADGMIGNASSPGADSIVGTYDDPLNATYHPPNPRYLYRIVYAEEIRN